MAIDTVYKNSEVCQTCANCCKSWVTYVFSPDEAIRVRWLDTDKIKLIRIKDDLWKVIFDIPCKQLIEEDGKYYCTKYENDIRPHFCGTYPNNFCGQEKLIIEHESKSCPIIKEVLEQSEDCESPAN